MIHLAIQAGIGIRGRIIPSLGRSLLLGLRRRRVLVLLLLLLGRRRRLILGLRRRRCALEVSHLRLHRRHARAIVRILHRLLSHLLHCIRISHSLRVQAATASIIIRGSGNMSRCRMGLGMVIH